MINFRNIVGRYSRLTTGQLIDEYDYHYDVYVNSYGRFIEPNVAKRRLHQFIGNVCQYLLADRNVRRARLNLELIKQIAMDNAEMASMQEERY